MDKEDKARLDTEKKRRADYLKKLRKEIRNGEKQVVQFMSLEQPPDPDITFSFEGVKDYFLVHGATYTLPTIVIEHLRSKKVPIYEQYDPDPKANTLKTEPTKVEDRIIGYKARFALNPVVIPTEQTDKTPA